MRVSKLTNTEAMVLHLSSLVKLESVCGVNGSRSIVLSVVLGWVGLWGMFGVSSWWEQNVSVCQWSQLLRLQEADVVFLGSRGCGTHSAEKTHQQAIKRGDLRSKIQQAAVCKTLLFGEKCCRNVLKLLSCFC